MQGFPGRQVASAQLEGEVNADPKPRVIIASVERYRFVCCLVWLVLA